MICFILPVRSLLSLLAGERLSWSGFTPERKQSPRAPRSRPRLRSAGETELWRTELQEVKKYQAGRLSEASPLLSRSFPPWSPHTPTPLTSRGFSGPGAVSLLGRTGSPTSEQTGGLFVGRVGRTELSDVSSHIQPPSCRVGHLPCHSVLYSC